MNDFPEIVVLTAPVTTNGGVTTDYINLENAHMVRAIFVFRGAVAHATGIDPVQATSVAGTGAKPITSLLPIWGNTDISLTSVLTPQAAAITYNIANSAKNQICVMDIDPAGLDVAGGFDCLAFTIDDSSQATDFVCAIAIITPRYQGQNMIVD